MRSTVLNKLDHTYLLLPNIYNSAIRKSLISKIISTDEKFFKAQTPDVYSGLRTSYEVESYPFLSYPVTISGVSAYSNGIATFNKVSSKIGSEFLKQNKKSGNQLDQTLPNVQCYPTTIIDSYLKILLRTKAEKNIQKIDLQRLYTKIIQHSLKNHQLDNSHKIIPDILECYNKVKKIIIEDKEYSSFYFNTDALLGFDYSYTKKEKKSLRNNFSSYIYEHHKYNLINNVELANDYYENFYSKNKYIFNFANKMIIKEYPFFIRTNIRRIIWLIFNVRLLFFKIKNRSK